MCTFIIFNNIYNIIVQDLGLHTYRIVAPTQRTRWYTILLFLWLSKRYNDLRVASRLFRDLYYFVYVTRRFAVFTVILLRTYFSDAKNCCKSLFFSLKRVSFQECTRATRNNNHFNKAQLIVILVYYLFCLRYLKKKKTILSSKQVVLRLFRISK
jgi:hypothetical protein